MLKESVQISTALLSPTASRGARVSAGTEGGIGGGAMVLRFPHNDRDNRIDRRLP
jgi:hypothetical protein